MVVVPATLVAIKPIPASSLHPRPLHSHDLAADLQVCGDSRSPIEVPHAFSLFCSLACKISACNMQNSRHPPPRLSRLPITTTNFSPCCSQGTTGSRRQETACMCHVVLRLSVSHPTQNNAKSHSHVRVLYLQEDILHRGFYTAHVFPKHVCFSSLTPPCVDGCAVGLREAAMSSAQLVWNS